MAVEAVIEPTDAPKEPKPASYYEVDVEPELMTFLVRASGSQNARRVAVAAYREVMLSGQGVSHRDASTERVKKDELEYLYGDEPPDFRENEAQRLDDDRELTGPLMAISLPVEDEP